MVIQIAGRVADVLQDEYAITVVLDDSSEVNFPVQIPCRFRKPGPNTANPDRAASVNFERAGIKVGDLVRIRGALKGREWSGKWFLDFSAFAIAKGMGAPAPAEGRPAARPARPTPPREAEPGLDDDDDLTF